MDREGIHAIWAMPNYIAHEYKKLQYKAILDEVTKPVHYSREAGNLSAGFLSRESLLMALRAMRRQTSLGHVLFVPNHLDMEALNLCNPVTNPAAYKLQRKVLYWEESEGSKDWYLIAKPDADEDTVACTTSPDDRPRLVLEQQGGGLTFKAAGSIKVKMLNPRMFHRAAPKPEPAR